jgi:hypothetical protein
MDGILTHVSREVKTGLQTVLVGMQMRMLYLSAFSPTIINIIRQNEAFRT